MINPSGHHELKALRRLGSGGGMLFFPFILLLLAELFVLPIDFFSFRVWEAALALHPVKQYRYPGPYYPNLHVKKRKEYGDQYRSGDPSRVKFKRVEWFTDAYGWRNRPEIEKQKKYDIVVLGDSNIVGSFLDQKDILTEIAGARSNKTAYSYSYGSDHISLYFSDSRMEEKSGGLLVIESKAGNWSTTQDYLNNFRELPDGSLDVVDRSAEFTSNYAPSRNHFLEKIESRITKQAMFHWLKASMATNFEVPKINKGELFIGGRSAAPSSGGSIWHPLNWVASGGISKPFSDDLQSGFTLQGPNYWKTGQFVSDRPDGKIMVRFKAKNSIIPSRHRVYIFEDGSYRSVGEFVAGNDWRIFEIPITTNLGSMLEFQIDQPDDWQWLSIKDFQVIGGEPPPLKNKVAIAVSEAIPTSSLTGQSESPINTPPNPFPKPPNLTPLDGSGRSLTVAESQYYFYHAAKALQRRTRERGMDFILFVMPDSVTPRLMPAIKQLRSEGIKVLAYEPQGNWTAGVNTDWYWNKADSHWTEAAVRLTADEILNMWKTQAVANRPFSNELQSAYSNGFPQAVTP